jgi:hypothetical protein
LNLKAYSLDHQSEPHKIARKDKAFAPTAPGAKTVPKCSMVLDLVPPKNLLSRIRNQGN